MHVDETPYMLFLLLKQKFQDRNLFPMCYSLTTLLYLTINGLNFLYSQNQTLVQGICIMLPWSPFCALQPGAS